MPQGTADAVEQFQSTHTTRKVGHPTKDQIIPIEVLVSMRIREKLSVTEIARRLNISHATVSKRLTDHGIDNLHQFKETKADMLALKQSGILNALSTEDIKKANLRDKCIAIGILNQNERLERGQSTEIIDHTQNSNRIKEIEARLKELDTVIDVTPARNDSR